MSSAAENPYAFWSDSVFKSHRRRARYGNLFLLSSLSLFIFQHLLNPKQKAEGLANLDGTILGPAVVMLLAVSWGTWFFLPCKSLFKSMEHWPQVSLKRLPTRRWFLGLISAFCLAVIPGPIDSLFGLSFLAVYLAANRMYLKKKVHGTTFSEISRRMHDLRLLWLGVLGFSWILNPLRIADAPSFWFSIIGFLVASISQSYPTLSFSYCFLQARRELAVHIQKVFWLGRFERLAIGGLLASFSMVWGVEIASLIVHLAPYFWSRALLNLSLRRMLQDETWRTALIGEEVRTKCRCGKVFPNRATFVAHRGTGIRDIVDIGNQREPSGLAARKRGKPCPLEARAALAILTLTLLLGAYQSIATQLNPALSQLQRASNYKSRIVPMGEEFLLVHKTLSQGEITLLVQALTNTPLKVRTHHVPGHGALDEVLGLLALGLLTLALSKSLNLGKPSIPNLVGILLGGLAMASIMGWIWVSSWLTGGCYLGYLILNKKISPKSKVKALLDAPIAISSRLSSGTVRPATCYVEQDSSVADYLRLDPLCIELGRGLFELILPTSEPNLTLKVKEGLEEYGVLLGIRFPQVRFKDDLALPSERIRLLVNGVEVAQRELLMPSQDDSPQIRQPNFLGPISAGTRFVIESLSSHIHEFLTLEETKRLLNRATKHNSSLVRKVLPIHTCRTIRQVLRPMLQEGFTIANHSTWLTVLAKGHGSVEELTRAVRAALEAEQPLDIHH